MKLLIVGVAVALSLARGLQSAVADTTLSAYYTGELVGNARGGIERGGAYLSDAAVSLETSFARSSDGAGGVLLATLLWNNPSTFSDRFSGDFQVVSNIDAGNALRLYEAWYEESFTQGLSLRFGLYDLNSEFDVIETAGLFINSSHGIGAEYAQSGLNGPSIFPSTSLSARFQATVGRSGTLRYALLDAVPGDPAAPEKTTIRFGDGVLHALEYSIRTAGDVVVTAGGWRYSASFDRLDRNGNDGRPLRNDGNDGVYGSVDAAVYQRKEGDLRVRAFLRYGVADERFNPLKSYLGAGISVAGLTRSRPTDLLGLAVASARAGEPYRRQFDAGRGAAHETTIELTWRAALTSWLSVQPAVQYVINPGVDPSLDDALVVSLRFTLTGQRPL